MYTFQAPRYVCDTFMLQILLNTIYMYIYFYTDVKGCISSNKTATSILLSIQFLNGINVCIYLSFPYIQNYIMPRKVTLKSLFNMHCYMYILCNVNNLLFL